MKYLLFAVVILSLVCQSCKKEVDAPIVNKKRSGFSYGNYKVTDTAKITSDRYGDMFFLTLAGYAGEYQSAPFLDISFINFRGPGKYGIKDGMTIYGAHGTDPQSAGYWLYDFLWNTPEIVPDMSITITANGEFWTIEVDGTLMHEGYDGQNTTRTYTKVKAYSNEVPAW